jgi:serine/threonine-protein kinase RsbW
MVSSPEQPQRCELVPPSPGTGLWREERIPSTAQEQHRVVEAVVSAMDAFGYGEADRFAMRLALEEALANAINHGHRGDPAKQIRIFYCVTTARVLAEVEDEGPGFDARLVPDPRTPERRTEPGGRGLLLMRAYMTRVCYTGRGNCVFLCRERSASPPA